MTGGLHLFQALALLSVVPSNQGGPGTQPSSTQQGLELLPWEIMGARVETLGLLALFPGILAPGLGQGFSHSPPHSLPLGWGLCGAFLGRMLQDM